jgi:hypothetical protein
VTFLSGRIPYIGNTDRKVSLAQKVLFIIEFINYVLLIVPIGFLFLLYEEY